jgi:hypothetical protein
VKTVIKHLLILLVGVCGATETYPVPRLDCPPMLDGSLDEPCWEDATVWEGYVQRDPAPGEPSTEMTRLYLGYTDLAIYVGVECLDSEPEGIVSNLRRRDSSVGADDNVDIWFDPTGSGLQLYYFSTNPAGVKFDCLYNNRATYSNYQYDAHWDVATRIDERGWTAEFEIPFSNFKFEENPHRYWLFNAGRVIRRKSEETYVVEVPYEHNMFDVEDAVGLTGIEGVSEGVGVKLVPYAKGEYRNLPEAGDGDVDDLNGLGGLDFDVDLGRSLTLAGTVLPDFAEIDLDPDQYQIGLDPVYTPETRPFFLRDSTYFNFTSYNPFYSRRIGKRLFTSEGLYVDSQILAGGRLTGKLGSFGLGTFYAHTGEAVTDLAAEPESDWAVIRLTHAVNPGSLVGLMGTARFARRVETDWETVEPAYEYASYGADFDIYFGEGIWNVWGSLLSNYDSRNAVNDFEDQFAASLGASFTEGSFQTWVSYADSSPRFDIGETGFFFGIPYLRMFTCNASHTWRFDDAWLRNFSLGANAVQVLQRDWEEGLSQYQLQIDTTTAFNWNFTVNGAFGYDNLYYNPGEADFWYYTSLSFSSEYGRAFWLHNESMYAEMADYTTLGYGEMFSNSTTVNVYPLSVLTLTGSYQVVRWWFREGEPVEDYTVNIWQGTADFLFTRELYLRLFAQGSDQNDSYTFRGLVGWEYLPDSHLYLAYERWYDDSTADFRLVNQGVFLKADFTLQL